MKTITESKLYRFFLNTGIYKAVAVCALMLTPSALFCFFPQVVSVILLLWGAFILLNDLFGGRHFFKAPFSVLLLAFILGYVVTLALFAEHDLVSTVHVFLWMILEFFLLYAFFDDKDIPGVFREMRNINRAASITATVSSLVSIVMLLLRVTVIMNDPEGLNQAWMFGVIGERNAGIFNNAIPFASCTFIGVVASAWNGIAAITRRGEPHRTGRIVWYVIAFVINYICLLSTLTRSFVYGAYILFGAAAFAAAYLYFKKRLKALRRWLTGIAAAFAAVAVVFGMNQITKTVVPMIANAGEPNIYILTEDGTINGMSMEDAMASWGLGKDIEMTRTEVGDNFLGPRKYVWSVALDVIPHSPILGFTSGNREATSLEYAVGDNAEYLAEHWKSGIPTYHNAYLDLIVSAGGLGLVLMLAFLGCHIIKTLRALFSKRTAVAGTNCFFYALLAALCATHVFVVCLFLGELVFTNISTCLYFWIALGALARCNQIVFGRSPRWTVGYWFDRFFRRTAEDKPHD